MTLQLILLIGFGGAIVTYFAGKISSKLREIFAVIISLLLVGMVIYTYGRYSQEILKIGFLDFKIVFTLNRLSWLFAIMISSLTALSIIFSISYMKGKENLNFYYMVMLFVNASMLGIVFSGTLLLFYIFWEIMSWSTFLLISYNKGKALNAGLKYVIMSIIGSMAMLVAIISVYIKFGTLEISAISQNINIVSFNYIVCIFGLFFIGFGIKSAIVPLHTWLPDAHSEAPSPFSAILSGILIKMGIYGFLLIMYIIVGIKILLALGTGWIKFHYILAWLGAISIVIPTFIALLQNDAKRLLAWHSIGQIGYIIVGISLGTGLGFLGGTFHIFNHAIFKALLFLCVASVAYQARTRNLNQLGGLIKKMPVTFIGALIGAFGIIGVPLTNGFVSKWLIYKTLILGNYPFLAFAALIGTWGTLLSFYKFLHNIFLGQLPKKYKNIKKEPISMQTPIIILSVAVILFGIFPGLILKFINNLGVSIGFQKFNISIMGISTETGILNMLNISFLLLLSIAAVFILFKIGKKSRKVSQEDNYAAGAPIPEGKYHYTVDFYAPLYKMISKYLKDIVDIFYYWIAGIVESLCNVVRKIYSGDIGTYVGYILLFLAVLIYIYLR
jgi:NADH-quinone oxidoreductase subunit M